MTAPLVLKVGGNDLDDDGFLARLASLLAGVRQRVVVVHGGGKGTSALSQRLGLEPRFVDGLRVTDDAALEAAIMGLVGLASVRISSALSAAGVRALGLCGADAGLVRVARLEHPAGDLGRVGRPVGVDVDALRSLLEAGFVPCVAPICAGEDGLYNVNADSVAQAVAAAAEAQALVFLTNVSGVRVGDEVVPLLTPPQVEEAIASGAVSGGMIPKVRAAVDALSTGVRSVLITNLDGLAAWLDGRATEGRLAGTTIAHAIHQGGQVLGRHHLS